MPWAVSSVAMVAQSAAAGLIAGLCMLQWFWWRNDRGRGGSGWLLTWTSAIAVLLVLNVVLAMIPEGAPSDVVLFLRSQVLAACVVLAVPTVRAFTGGPPVLPWVLAATAGFAGRAVAWLAGGVDVVQTGGVPAVRGPLGVWLFLLPVAVIGAYVVLALRRLGDRRARALIGSTSALSIVLLALPYLLPVGSWTHPLAITWALPMVAGLTVVAVRRLAVVERDTHRQHTLRDALADIGKAAWFAREPERLVARAQATARLHVGDPTITATVQPLPGGRFTATLVGDAGVPADPRTRAFLEDLARTVSIAVERMSLARDLEQAAFTDALTGLPNRHALERHLTRAITGARERNTQVAVLHCDLDGFKAENDLHGHAWGDAVLVQTARHLQAQAQAPALVARFGGDQFVVVVESRPADDLVDLAHRLRDGRSTSDPDRPAPRMSVGVAQWCPESAGVAEDLLRQADTAMLEAKRTRAGVVVFDDALRARMQADVDLRRELDVALVQNEFTVHFQPVVDARTMAVVGVEALARWEHGGRTRMPGEWLPFAEDTGLIVPIGRTVLGVARARAGAMGHPVMVNVAARQLAEPSFVDQLVEDWGDGDWTALTLEITESALLQDMPHVIASLATLRRLGARIAIDDFGTGYSSFARLATLPVDVLKIDRAFVAGVTTDEGAAVVRAIVSLAEAYGLDVVAEGVETVEQLDALIELGVPKLQGYLLGRPAAGRPAPVRVRRPVRSPQI